MNINLKNKYYLLLPVFFSFILALIITLSNNFPLSWDIYTHISYSLAYLHDGFTNVDYLLNAPEGKTIGYPPFFHLILIITSIITRLNLVDSARVLQILLTVCNVFTVTFVASKIKDEKVGLFAGLLLISSFMFTRLLLPIPETLAMIFFTLTVYCYYKASTEARVTYSILAAILSLLSLATHFSSFIYLMILLFVLMFVQLILLKSFDAVEYYVYIIIPIFLLGLLTLVVLFVISPSYLSHILAGIVSIVENPFDLFMGQIAMGLERYIKCVGLIPLIFAIIGLYYSYKNKEFLFVSIWALIAFIITNLHWFGIPVYTFRLLLYLIIPMVMLGGYAVSNIFEMLESQNNKSSIIFVILIIILSLGSGFMNINDSSVNNYSSTSELSTYHIAPPTSDEVEVINWFKNEDVGNKSVLTNNLFFGTVLSSIDEIPLHYSFDVYTNKSLSKSSSESLNEEQIGYIVYDKSLTMQNTSDYQSLSVRFVNGSYYPSYYFTKEITDDNFNTIKLQSSETVFENGRFIICKII